LKKAMAFFKQAKALVVHTKAVGRAEKFN